MLYLCCKFELLLPKLPPSLLPESKLSSFTLDSSAD